MNLTISAINNTPQYKNVSFGFAKFSPQGLRLAQSCSDIYECLGEPNEYQNPDFFKKKGIFSQAPFTKYLKEKLSSKSAGEEEIKDVQQTMIDCGTTENGHSNAAFIKQLLASKKQIDKLPTKAKTAIAASSEFIFRHNWNNPELSKAETYELLEMAKPQLEDSEYATLVGVIEKSDM